MESDAALFTTLVQYVDTAGLQFDDPKDLEYLRIDPRMIDSTYQQFTRLEEEHLQSSSSKLLKKRIKIIEKFDLEDTDIIADLDCVFSQGLPDPSNLKDPEKLRSDVPPHCKKKGFFLSIIFGQPKSTSIDNCAESDFEQNESPNFQCFAVRADEYTSYSELSFRLYIKKDPVEGWVVVGKELLGGSYS
ncbi:hypothetical protein LQ318_07865 [Aliifodinibius salicampi]|uniref:Uncharacterized protein n=1 Tax=Fodinibius salicampi TaxID=1920655 RepID=A0ABT3PYA1_9BACT|nr:hypothetical protein [Fodinibius salicampi]MCW9712818.1 hypothetical protein [Fodinibius salicampi]